MSHNPETPKLSKAESARINGARSHGASSPEGQLRAANGNLKHGIYSTRVVMQGENPEAYAALLASFKDLFQPTDTFEYECIVTMANCTWRIRRLECAETDALNAAILTNKPYIETRFEALDYSTERALAIHSENINLERNSRLEERLHRIYDRKYKLLTDYRRKSCRSKPQPAETVADIPVETPDPPTEADQSGNEAAIPMNPPNSSANPSAAPASLISKIALILFLFASLFLSPAQNSASKIALTASHTLPTSLGAQK